MKLIKLVAIIDNNLRICSVKCVLQLHWDFQEFQHFIS